MAGIPLAHLGSLDGLGLGAQAVHRHHGVISVQVVSLLDTCANQVAVEVDKLLPGLHLRKAKKMRQ